MKDVIIKLYGRNGVVELYANRILIKRKECFQKSMIPLENKIIYLDDLKSINFSKPTEIGLGYIQFETVYNTGQLSNGLFMTSPLDNFSISFGTRQESDFELLKQELCYLCDKVFNPNDLIDSTGWC